MTKNAAARRAGRPRQLPNLPPTREKILLAAADLFSRDGFTGVSIRDITRTVGIKESSLYNHFENKEALLDAIFDRMESEFAARALTEESLRFRIDQLTPEQFMRASFRRFMAFWSDPVRVRLWFVISMEQYRNARAARLVLHETRRVVDLVAFVFREMQKKKEIVPLNAHALAETYAGTLRGMQTEFAILKSAGMQTRGVQRRMNAFISFFAALVTA